MTVVDAALIRVNGASAWLKNVRIRLAHRDGTLVLRHLEALDDAMASAVVALLATADPPGQLVIGTLAEPADGQVTGPTLRSHFPAAVRVPPLRERPEDIADIVPVLIGRHSDGTGRRCQPAVIQALIRASWPHNVRQLETVLQGMLARSRAIELTVGDLPSEYRNLPWRRLTAMERAERAAIAQALEAAGGNKSLAAASLGIARATLYRKLKELGV